MTGWNLPPGCELSDIEDYFDETEDIYFDKEVKELEKETMTLNPNILTTEQSEWLQKEMTASLPGYYISNHICNADKVASGEQEARHSLGAYKGVQFDTFDASIVVTSIADWNMFKEAALTYVRHLEMEVEEVKLEEQASQVEFTPDFDLEDKPTPDPRRVLWLREQESLGWPD